MSLPTVIAIFFTVWWTVLFAVLPFGVRSVKTPQPGHATSAPERPYLARKFFATTVITIILTGIIYVVAEKGIDAMRREMEDSVGVSE